MNAQKKEEKTPVIYCVLEKTKNPIGRRLSATPYLDYLWLYYYNGVKDQYNVYKVTKYTEIPTSCRRKGFIFIEATAVELYNEVFEDYMKHREKRLITIEEMKLPLAIQRNIQLGRREIR